MGWDKYKGSTFINCLIKSGFFKVFYKETSLAKSIDCSGFSSRAPIWGGGGGGKGLLYKKDWGAHQKF